MRRDKQGLVERERLGRAKNHSNVEGDGREETIGEIVLAWAAGRFNEALDSRDANMWTEVDWKQLYGVAGT